MIKLTPHVQNEHKKERMMTHEIIMEKMKHPPLVRPYTKIMTCPESMRWFGEGDQVR